MLRSSRVKALRIRIVQCLSSPVWVSYRIHRSLAGNKQHFSSYSQFLSLVPGKLGDYIRYGFYSMVLAQVGGSTRICFGVTISDSETVIGDRVYIGPFSNIGRCIIGDDVIIATGVHIISGVRQHKFDDVTKTVWQQPGVKETITIGNDCWIGNRSLVASNIGMKCIIGAASVVVDDIPSYSVAVGHPARVIKSRRECEG